MFILHSSNKTENLVFHLTAVIESSPLSSPMVKEVFLIQSQGMERWLCQQLAGHFHVWANYEFFFPNKFFSAMAQKIDSRLNDSVFDRDFMVWRFESLLRRIPGAALSSQSSANQTDDFAPLRHYLSGENLALKRYQLARQLAQIFDQYQLMRPDMLDAWQQHRTIYGTVSERWQKILWLEIIKMTGLNHRGSLWLNVIDKLTTSKAGTFSQLLPERISVFGLNTMPPLFLNYLQGLSNHCQVHLFLLNPAQIFWADWIGKRAYTEQELLAGHPLLSILGQQGREFQEMLLEHVNFDFEPESFEPILTPNNLQHLQNDILNNRNANQVLQNDGSISIHACHSRMREVEVLRDQLLDLLEKDIKLELRDIVVMAPDIQHYEPFIAAVFTDIQHAIADRSLRLSNSILDAFIRFLNVSQSRFGWRSVLDVLEQPEVYPAFGLSATDLDLLKHWLLDTHVRWGKSVQHMQELDLPEINTNTWQSALDRLLMGYAVGSEEEFVDTVLPYRDIEGSSATALGGLCAYLQLLFDAGNELRQPKTLNTWHNKLSDFVGRLFGNVDSNERQQINELLAGLVAEYGHIENEGYNDEVELQVIIAWLEDRVSEHKSAKGFLRGQLTFCSMLPMRSIPFKVIALLGMNEGEFPKVDRAPTFDLLAQNFRKGDRSRRADDRYQFLEILLSARQQLVITFIGQSMNHNETIPPSAAISELLEVLRASYQLTDLIIQHPLQSFSQRYFDGSAHLFSYSEADYKIATALSNPKTPPSVWWKGEVAELSPNHIKDEVIVEIADLFSFFQHPQCYFMRRQLDINFSGLTEEASEREPFAIDGLTSYAIRHEWVKEALNGNQFTLQKLQARGCWPLAGLGNLEYERQRYAVDSFVERIKAKNLGEPLDNLPIDLKINGYRLIGLLNNRFVNGSLFYRFTNLKGKDFLNAWLHHLIINQYQEQSTYLISSDDDLQMLPSFCRPDYLTGLIDIYLRGQQIPHAFFVEAAFAYIQQAVKLNSGGQSTKSALDMAITSLTNALEKNNEPELFRLYGNIADLGQVLDDAFECQCKSLLQPIWEAMHG